MSSSSASHGLGGCVGLLWKAGTDENLDGLRRLLELSLIACGLVLREAGCSGILCLDLVGDVVAEIESNVSSSSILALFKEHSRDFGLVLILEAHIVLARAVDDDIVIRQGGKAHFSNAGQG